MLCLVYTTGSIDSLHTSPNQLQRHKGIFQTEPKRLGVKKPLETTETDNYNLDIEHQCNFINIT